MRGRSARRPGERRSGRTREQGLPVGSAALTLEAAPPAAGGSLEAALLGSAVLKLFGDFTFFGDNFLEVPKN